MTTYPPGMTLRPLDGWPTEFTANRRRSPFGSTFTATLEVLTRELRALGPHGLRSVGNTYYFPRSVLQIALRERDFRSTDGMPRANSVPEHPGVILTIEPKDRPPLSFPCDTFDRWQDNLRGIALGLEALRKKDRYGITQTGQQYRGWQAIEAKPTLDAKTAACAFLARIAWPNENDEHQAKWAPKIAVDKEIGRNTLRQARSKAHPDRNNGDQTLWDHVEQMAAVLRAAGAEWME